MNEHRNCTCPASKSGSFQIATDHYSRNFIPTGWKLEYTSLEQHEPQRFLYMTGWCLRCGGQDLQSGISIPDELSGDALLERIYREMEHYRPFEHRRSDGTYPEFVEKLNYIVQKLFMALRRDGRLAILVGDIRTKGSFYSMQHDLMRVGQMEAFIVKGQYNCVSDTRSYLGRLKELMDGKRKNGYAYGRGEKYSLELGGDINRAIASEFAMLAAPETLPLFLRKLQRKALKQYQRREPICKGSGDIICMLDESSSAESQAPWCKAVALALLDIAMRDQRRFAVIHFAGVGDVQTDLFLPGQYDREDVLRCAETFLNGNTDYETPLREALRLMEQEGFENADMVFVTDGECVLPDSFLEKLKAEQSARGFQITGILLDQEDAGFEFSLRESCTNVYRTSQLSRDQIAEQLVVSRVA